MSHGTQDKMEKASEALAISNLATIVTLGMDGIHGDLIKYPGYTIEDAKIRAKIRLEDAKNVVYALEKFCK